MFYKSKSLKSSDSEHLLFAAIAPRGDGTIDVEPLLGVGSATFSRASVAMVRDYDNVYREASSGEARIQGARYSSGTYYWQLADGTALHPVINKTNNSYFKLENKFIGSDIKANGLKIFATYNKWEASTAYSVGDKIIPATGSGPAGGNGYWYECTTAGTSDSSEPTFTETIDDTTTDNTVTWTCRGYYRIAGYLAEPERTNETTYSYDLTNWTQVGTSVSALDETGIDGISNKATTLTDDDGATFESMHKDTTIPNDSSTHCAQFFIKKDADTSRFVGCYLIFINGTTYVRVRTHLNTSTGELTVESFVGTYTAWVENHNNWWRVILTLTNNTSGNTVARQQIYPAHGTVFGTESAAATGSCIVGHAQLELNTSVPSSPIETNGATATRSVDDLYYSSSNVDVNNGSVLANFSQLSLDTSGETETEPVITISDAQDGVLYYLDNKFAINDGTGVADSGTTTRPNYIKEVPTFVNGASRYNSTDDAYQAHCNGGSGTEGSFDGAIVSGGNLEICRSAEITRPAVIKNILIYNRDLGASYLESLTTYD